MKQNMFIKIICGFRKDQHYTIPADEAHKAYYLFLNPQERGIFSTGLALTGMQIQAIDADYNATMGWNPDHDLKADDWNQILDKGVDRLLRDALYAAKKEAIEANPARLALPLSEIVKPLIQEPI